MFALAVVLSILVLAAGTTLVAAGRASEVRLVNVAVRAFTLVVAPTAVLIGIVPHLYEEIGALGPALVAAGFALLWLAEHRGRHLAGVATALVVPTLALHSLFDGASLSLVLGSARGPASPLLALTLVAHRLPEGLFIGHTLLPRVGTRSTGATVVLLAAATVAGSVLGREAFGHLGGKVVCGIVATGVGIVLRALLHRHAPAHPTSGAVLEAPPSAPARDGLG